MADQEKKPSLSRPKFLALCASGASVSLQAACGQQAAPPQTAAPEPTTAAAPTAAAAASTAAAPAATTAPAATAVGGSRINIVIEGQPPNLDNHLVGARIGLTCSNPVNGFLVQFDQNGVVQPYIARSYEIVDPTTVQFTLRDNATFHNGRKVVAADVKASIERVKDPANGSPRRERVTAISEIQTPDDTTVILKLA